MAKLSISRAWDETRDTLARNGSLLTTLALALFVLPGIISELATPPVPAGEFPEPGLWMVVTAVALLIALIGQLAVIRLAIGSRLTVGEAIGHGARRAPAYLGASLLWILPFLLIGAALLGRAAMEGGAISPGAAIGLLLLGCIMLFFAIRMMMTSPVASAEPLGPVGIVRRSWQLTSGHWLRLFAFFLLFVVAAVVVVTAVGAIAGIIAEVALGGVEPMTVGALFEAIVTQLMSAAVSVLLMLMLARIYVQLAGAGAAEATVPHSGT